MKKILFSVGSVLCLLMSSPGQAQIETNDAQQLKTNTNDPDWGILTDYDTKLSLEFQILSVGISIRKKVHPNWSWGTDLSLGPSPQFWNTAPPEPKSRVFEFYNIGLMVDRQLYKGLHFEFGYSRVARSGFDGVIEHRGAVKTGIFIHKPKFQVGFKTNFIYAIPSPHSHQFDPGDSKSFYAYSSLIVMRFTRVFWKDGKKYKAKNIKF